MGSFPSSILAGLPELNVPAQWKTLYFLFPPLLFSKSLHCFLKLQSDPKFPITGFCFGSPDLSLYTLDEQPRLFPHHLSPSHFLSSQHIKLILSWEYEENGPISPILNPVSPHQARSGPAFRFHSMSMKHILTASTFIYFPDIWRDISLYYGQEQIKFSTK